MITCEKCKNVLMKGENCFGVPLQGEYYCCSCWERMSENHRARIKNIVPITRAIMTDEWKLYCEKFGLKA